jgi:peptidoglycan hydrolase-like protein with peptidoglycan-binding domain
MKKFILALSVTLAFTVAVAAQNPSTTQTAAAATAASDEKPKRQIFRANKDQIMQVQTMLKTNNLYTGEASGKLDDATRASIKAYQAGNGLKETGTLNRATLEKMGIELTDRQKLIPVSDSSYASTDAKTSGPSASDEPKTKRVIFRATKDQIMEAQRMLKSKAMYAGEETGKLDDATRDGLKKYQEANGVKVTGTLNQVTLEKMGIALTDKQKADAASANK